MFKKRDLVRVSALPPNHGFQQYVGQTGLILEFNYIGTRSLFQPITEDGRCPMLPVWLPTSSLVEEYEPNWLVAYQHHFARRRADRMKSAIMRAAPEVGVALDDLQKRIESIRQDLTGEDLAKAIDTLVWPDFVNTVVLAMQTGSRLPHLLTTTLKPVKVCHE